MRELTDAPAPERVLDEFVGALLGCGAVLSQIISQMVRHATVRGPVPDVAPIPVAAHELLVEVLSELVGKYRSDDLKTASGLLNEATDRLCDEVFFIPPEELDRLERED